MNWLMKKTGCKKSRETVPLIFCAVFFWGGNSTKHNDMISTEAVPTVHRRKRGTGTVPVPVPTLCTNKSSKKRIKSNVLNKQILFFTQGDSHVGRYRNAAARSGPTPGARLLWPQPSARSREFVKSRIPLPLMPWGMRDQKLFHLRWFCLSRSL